MILNIILGIILFLLLLLLLYPVRVGFMAYFTEYEPRFRLVLYPVFTLERFAKVLVDTEQSPGKSSAGKKKAKSEKSAKSGKADKTKKGAKARKPGEGLAVSELLTDIIALLGKLKRGLKKLPLTLNLGYGLEDPALTGEITGIAYSTLPPLLGDGRPGKCCCRLRLYPAWCPTAPCIDARGELTCNLLLLLIALVPLLPTVLGLIIKFKRK